MVRQPSFDELGIPLSEASFCVLDLETTGGSPRTDFITEVGAVRVRGGEIQATLQTLVNPGCAVPPKITMVTGITTSLVLDAPPINAVLPTLLEFIGGSVIVGHNLRFDMSFISAALRRWNGPLLGNQQVDTLALARRLLIDEVPKFSLGELSRYYRFPHQPSHRALDDAWATVDLLHLLIERAAAWGVKGLDDLVALPSIVGHPQWKKLQLTTELPRKPGVYTFRDRNDKVLYVGKATDLRSRVRSYFSSDKRRKVAQLLRETDRITHQVCRNTLEAEVLEMRLIKNDQPRFNRVGRRPLKPKYVKLTTSEPFPRLSVVSSTKGPGVYLGPIAKKRTADLVVEAIQTVVPLRRCTQRLKPGEAVRLGSCASAQLGVATCPCAGEVTTAEYDVVSQQAARVMTSAPHEALVLLEQRMRDLGGQERFEEALQVRNRAAAFADAVAKQRRLQQVTGVGQLTVETSEGVRIRIGELEDPEHGSSVNPQSLEEWLCVGSWLDRNATKVRVVTATGQLASPLPRLPNYQVAS